MAVVAKEQNRARTMRRMGRHETITLQGLEAAPPGNVVVIKGLLLAASDI